MATEYVEFLDNVDKIMSQPEYLSESTAKGFNTVVSKLGKAHKQLENNLHTITVALSELKKLRVKDEFAQHKDEISERAIDLDRRVVQSIRSASEDLENILEKVAKLATVEKEFEEEIDEEEDVDNEEGEEII